MTKKDRKKRREGATDEGRRGDTAPPPPELVEKMRRGAPRNKALESPPRNKGREED